MLMYRTTFIWVTMDFKAQTSTTRFFDLEEALQHIKAQTKAMNDLISEKEIRTFKSIISSFDHYDPKGVQ